MSPARWLVLGVLLAASLGVQSLGLDSGEEMKLEEKYRRVADIPATDMVPTYVASLFFGAFRAVVVDALWIQLKKIEEEHRWYEQRQTIQLISYFQPRNPEVWAHLGWHSAYNIANGFTDPEKSWDWVKFGLKWLREGNSRIPDSPYLKFELARTLYFKPTWRGGYLERDLLSRIENDKELQGILNPGPPSARPLSAFELAVPWLERGREELLKRTPPYVITQTGLYIRPLTLDGFMREALYYQAIYLWQQKRWEEAKEAFQRLTDHTHAIVQREYKSDFKSPIFADEEKWSARIPEIIDLDRKAEGGSREAELALLAKLQSLVIEFGALDRGFFCNRERGDGRLDRLKRKLSGNQ
ncbi:MAG TPA: tetratricopeptide repeat protein, partial [Planctomycetota bacterium]|nr:tetratricopeptide repeat protein [Planctomycetota bacterium]